MSLKPPLPPTGTAQSISWSELDGRLDTEEATSVSLVARTLAMESGHVFVTTLSASTGAAAANKVIIDAALAAASVAGGGVVWIRQVGRFYTDGSHEIPVGVIVVGLGRATVLMNRGATYCFRLMDETSGGPKCGLRDMEILGSASGVAAVSGGIGVELSNGYGYDIDNVHVSGFNSSGVGWKFHNQAGTVEWTGGHSLRNVSAVNCTKCVEFIADADAEAWFGEIDIDKILIQPGDNQTGIALSRSFFYNNRIVGSLFFAGDNAIGIELVTATAQVREGSYFDLRGETSAGNTGCKRLKATAAGQFSATGTIFITNGQPPDDMAAASLFSFVEDPHSYLEAVQASNFAIASNGTITIPGGCSYLEITGGTTITVINSWLDGETIAFWFSGSPTLSAAGNMKLDGGVDFAATPGDTIVFGHRGGVFRELARTVLPA